MPATNGKGGSSWPEPPLLNAWISKADSAHALLRLHLEHGARMDAMHLGNMWNKLGRQLKWQTGKPQKETTEGINRLALATTALLEAQSCRRPDVLANIAHGAAQAEIADATAARDLFRVLALAAASVCDHPKCEPRHLANLAWAFATASQPHPSLFDGIAKASAPLLGAKFNSQELGMLSWSFAKLEHRGATGALASAASSRAVLAKGRVRPGQAAKHHCPAAPRSRIAQTYQARRTPHKCQMGTQRRRVSWRMSPIHQRGGGNATTAIESRRAMYPCPPPHTPAQLGGCVARGGATVLSGAAALTSVLDSWPASAHTRCCPVSGRRALRAREQN